MNLIRPRQRVVTALAKFPWLIPKRFTATPAPAPPSMVMTVGQDVGDVDSYGYSTAGLAVGGAYGVLVPTTTVGGTVITRFVADAVTNVVIVNTAGNLQIDGTPVLIFQMDALTVSLTWDGFAYADTDAVVAAYLVAALGTDVFITA